MIEKLELYTNIISMIIDKIFEGNSVNVVFTTNNKYAKYMTVAIRSLIEQCSDNRNYDIIIFETDVEKELQNIIESMADDYNNISIRFLNVNSIFEEHKNENFFCHIYLSKEMYLRLFIPEILQNYEKAIYIDCDTIVQKDVAELFDIDISQHYIGAARDFNSIVNALVGYEKVKYYFKSILKIENMNNYINSGVLLMNLVKLREIDITQKAFKILQTYKELLYPDQDLLNLICIDNIKYLHPGWNFVFAINPMLVSNNRVLESGIEWTKGLSDQRIIHYISEIKPWTHPNMSYGDIWWAYAKKTPIYQTLLKEFFDANPELIAKHSSTPIV